MLAVGAAVLLAGYTLAFWGNKIRTGAGVGLADVIIPGHYETGPLPPVTAASGASNPKPGEHLANATRPAPVVPRPVTDDPKPGEHMQNQPAGAILRSALPAYPAPRLP